MYAFWVTFVLAVVASAATATQDLKLVKIPKLDAHNIIKCNTESDQRDWKRLDSETVSANGMTGEIVQRTINYPRDGIGRYKIECIRVLDQIGDGTGGYPSILDGGLNFRHVTIHFDSQLSHGFKFSVEIWGVDTLGRDGKSDS